VRYLLLSDEEEDGEEAGDCERLWRVVSLLALL